MQLICQNMSLKNQTHELLKGTSYNLPCLMPLKILYNSNINNGCVKTIDISTSGFRCNYKFFLLYQDFFSDGKFSILVYITV